MALITKEGNYIKIKDGSITSNGLSYYKFKNKETREALTDEDLKKAISLNLYMNIDLKTIPIVENESIENSLKTYCYGLMKEVIVKETKIVEVKKFEGSVDDI
jgi:hypothetical protein